MWHFHAALGLAVAMALAGCAARDTGPAGRPVVMEGEIVDPLCWFTHGGEGPAHRECAQLCARGGQDLAFLNRAGERLYPIIAARHGANPNDSLIAMVGYPVVIEARMFVRHGQRGLQMVRVRRLDLGAKPDSGRTDSAAAFGRGKRASAPSAGAAPRVSSPMRPR